MTVTLEFPAELDRLREEVPDFDKEAMIAVALDWFRKEQIGHYELSRILGLDRYDTDTFLKARGEFAQCLTAEEVWEDVRTIKEVLAEMER